jgi:hypothetical protein
VFDDDGGGKSELIGETETILTNILNAPGQTLDLEIKLPVNPAKPDDAKKSKRGKIIVRVMSFAEVQRKEKPETPGTFVDYISSDWTVSMMAAIDYTESNGLAKDPNSLHFIGEAAHGSAN